MKNLYCIEKSVTRTTQEELACVFVTEFTDNAVSKFYTEFIKLESNIDVKIIPIVISSYGGQVYSLLAMLDILSSSSKIICTIGIGKAMSCGSVLLAAGTKGYRYAGRNTDVMIHEVSSVSWGKTTDVKEDAKNTSRLNDILLHKLANFCKKDKKYFHKLIKSRSNADLFLSADKCKEINLVDHVGVPALLKK